MTTHLLHGKPGEATPPDRNGGSKGLAIGETDVNVFNCPACERPLSEGTSRCPGCGVRLIMGVMVKRAGAILALGIAFGILFGGAVTASAITLSLHDSKPAIATLPSVAPVAASAAPSSVARVAAAPQTAISALSGTAVVNGRIAIDATTLSATLATPKATTIEIARALRSLAADAALGSDLVGRLAPWRDAEPVKTQLDAFYQTMAETARIGLRASLTDEASYRTAAASMATVLGSLGEVDSASRTLATTVYLELPPVAFPGAASSGASTAP